MSDLFRHSPLMRMPHALRSKIRTVLQNCGSWLFRHAVNAAQTFHMLPRPEDGKGILIVHLTSHFGDSVMLLPLLEALHREHPDIAIDIACARGVESLFEAVAFVRAVYSAPVASSPPFRMEQALQHRLDIVRWYRRDLRHLHPRVCLMPRWGDDLFGSMMLAYLVGSPVRIGYASTVTPNQAGAPQRDRMLTTAVEGGNGLHEPQRALRLAQKTGLLPQAETLRTDAVSQVLVQVSATVAWQPLRRRLGLPEHGRTAVLAPGASTLHRRWPTAHWAALGHELIKRGYNIVLLSGKSDRLFAEAVLEALMSQHAFLVAGVTSIPESVALLAHCDLFIGNDSGPGHAAGALGLPTAVLFASERQIHPDHPLSPQRIRPMGPYVATLHPTMRDECVGCCTRADAHCIAGISVQEVLEAALELQERRAAVSALPVLVS